MVVVYGAVVVVDSGSGSGAGGSNGGFALLKSTEENRIFLPHVCLMRIKMFIIYQMHLI